MKRLDPHADAVRTSLGKAYLRSCQHSERHVAKSRTSQPPASRAQLNSPGLGRSSRHGAAGARAAGSRAAAATGVSPLNQEKIGTERGSHAPELARMVLGGSPLPEAWRRGSGSSAPGLACCSWPTAAADVAAPTHNALGFTRGDRQRHRAARLPRPLVARAARTAGPAVTRLRAGLLTCAADRDAAPVQLMGLHQTKGREADATGVVVRSSDFCGTEPAPFPAGSRLPCLVLTRARHKTTVLLSGHEPPALMAPLASLADRSASCRRHHPAAPEPPAGGARASHARTRSTWSRCVMHNGPGTPRRAADPHGNDLWRRASGNVQIGYSVAPVSGGVCQVNGLRREAPWFE